MQYIAKCYLWNLYEESQYVNKQIVNNFSSDRYHFKLEMFVQFQR